MKRRASDAADGILNETDEGGRAMESGFCLPLVKWAGGKRQLMGEIRKRMPKEFGTYYEPFLGGGALFFELNPKKAVLSDVNPQLIGTYRQVSENPDRLLSALDEIKEEYNALGTDEERSACYYAKRRRYNELIEAKEHTTETAALFIFLNKTAFNGVYRVNSKGLFNVPTSRKKKVELYDAENFRKASTALGNARLLCGDFEDACSEAEEGDFVFFDSPYYDTFDGYGKDRFSKEDHERLARLFRRLSSKGVRCMLTNSDEEFIRNLYSDFRIETAEVKRLVNRDASARTGREIIVTGY